ncbi:hypothetical protein [Thiocystis violacea]|uniref:hypothetical protein n=1 Tax=Thiocystis violacea TaxID=13725 RepID=UPI0019082940|nr:hypothetical protein [Thiocystis violacea]MBK1721972.1 hypothetical protein [Thiocystis violacea]
MTEEILGHCWRCARALSTLDYGRETSCIGCGKPTRCCRNCRHYAPGRANECVEPMVERILDKTAANFCELFEPTTPGAGASSVAPETDALRQAAEALFK